MSVYATKKEELEKNMSDAITILEIAKVSCSERRKEIDTVTSSAVILKDELKISHKEIDTAYLRKEELAKEVEAAINTLSNLKNDTAALVTSINAATTTHTDYHWRRNLIHIITRRKSP